MTPEPPPVPALPARPPAALRGRRCVRHDSREAVARCPECGGAFCRECVVEHAGRLLCATCLAKTAAPVKPARPPRDFGGLRRTASLGAAVLALWLVFHLLGSLLVRIPVEVHDATFWAPARERSSPRP